MLNYKKPAFWVVAAAVVACALVTVCFATNPVTAEPNTPNAKRPTLIMNGDAYVNPYMPVSYLPHGYRSAGKLTKEQANNTELEGGEYFTHPLETEDFYTYQECGTPVDLDTVDNEQRQWAYMRWIPVKNDAIENRKLTLDDVIMLTQKGDALTWSDFERYQGREIGSGLYIMRYEIDELFDVLVGGVPNETPMYIRLRNQNNNAWVDLREDGAERVKAFIETYTAVREYAPEIEALREKYPEYFALGTFKGLEVYVWQMAEGDYRFGLMQGTNRVKTLEEKMALKGATAEEMALILSAFDIEDKDIFVIPWQNPISSYMVTEDVAKNPEYINNIRAMLGLDGISTRGAGAADAPAPDEAATTLSEEQTAIRQAILAHNKSSYPLEYDVACCSFITLETLSGTPMAGSSTHKITYYGWALYEAYKVTDGGLETVSGSHIPVALSFDLDERGYTLTEYWEPRDGSYYPQDIREKFPSHIAEDGIDSQKYILLQKQECYAQAIASTGLDTDQVIGSLIETICSGPALSSNPADYIEEHPIEYRELTFYGRYTLKHCFARFEQGGETGLAGHIMARACEDIADSWGEEPLVFSQADNGVFTGQMWYSAFKNNARNLTEQYSEIEIAERYPASKLLLSMLEEVPRKEQAAGE